MRPGAKGRGNAPSCCRVKAKGDSMDAEDISESGTASDRRLSWVSPMGGFSFFSIFPSRDILTRVSSNMVYIRNAAIII
jgi:hypothetical protein